MHPINFCAVRYTTWVENKKVSNHPCRQVWNVIEQCDHLPYLKARDMLLQNFGYPPVVPPGLEILIINVQTYYCIQN